MPRAGLNPERVVDVAAELVDEVGHDGLTLAAIAERAGVAVPSLYKHVGGIDDVYARLAVRTVRQLGRVLADAVDGAAPPVALRRLATAYRGYARSHPGRYAATLRAPAPDDAEHLAASQEVLATVLGVLGGYGLDGDDTIDAARFVRSTLHGFVALEAAGGFGLPRGVDRSFTRIGDALDHALSTWA